MFSLRRNTRSEGLSARASLLMLAAALALATPFAIAHATDGDRTDPVRNVPLACELVSTPGMPARANRNIFHAANVCGIVGTDVELQSRTDLAGEVHDYAFVGTMGAGFQIYDVTDPAHPQEAGGYTDSGWQNDVQVRGDIVVSTFDGIAGENSSMSTCLRTRYPNGNGQGVDIFRLDYNELTADFETNLLTCVSNPPGGAHNSTLHPSGQWLAISDCCSDWAVDVIDLRNVLAGEAVHRYRLIDESRRNSAGRCPEGATFTCIVMTRSDGSSASGLWQPHDVHFSQNGRTMYVAAINSTFLVDVRNVLSGHVRTISIVPNISEPGGLENPRNISISHQADVSSDGRILVISDERGGGVSETRCNQQPNGMLGGLHFWALARISGVPATQNASPSNPVKLGSYFNPNPNVVVDPLQPFINQLPRTERGCTVHVFRLGGNGSVSPGPIQAGYDGVSRMPNRQLSTAWYGGGVWHVSFAGPPSNVDGIAEDSRTTPGATRTAGTSCPAPTPGRPRSTRARSTPATCSAASTSTPTRARGERSACGAGDTLAPQASPLVGLRGCGDGAELLHETQRIPFDPLFHGLAVDDPPDRDPRQRHRLAGRGHALEVTPMLTADCPARDHLVAFGDLVLDRDLQVGEGQVELSEKSLVFDGIHRSVSARHVDLRIRGQDLIERDQTLGRILHGEPNDIALADAERLGHILVERFNPAVEHVPVSFCGHPTTSSCVGQRS
jgi:hypothetical protein